MLHFLGNSAGGYLSFKPSIPKSLILEGEHNLDTHFTLINYQVVCSNNKPKFFSYDVLNCLSSEFLFLFLCSDETNKNCACDCFIIEPYTGKNTLM